MTRVALFDASTGQITCGTVDGKNLATLYAAVIDHDHGLSGYTGYYEPVMTLYDADDGTTFQIGGVGGSGSAGRTATATDKHRHTIGTLATNVETATAGTGPSDDLITIACASGDAVADLINAYAPDELWERFDGHYHSMTGVPAQYEMAAFRPKNSTTYKYFHTASDDAGTDPHWEEVTTASGWHGHTIGNLSLAAYTASGAGGAGSGASIKFAIRAATGNLETDRNCNGIDISDFWTQHFAHTAHSVTGATANAVLSNAQIWGVTTGDYYFETTSGVWKLAYARRLPHSHSGAGIVVAAPS